MLNVTHKICRENQNRHFILNNFSSENRVVCEIKWKMRGHRWQYNRAHALCMLDN
jgi:hypothetical protein